MERLAKLIQFFLLTSIFLFTAVVAGGFGLYSYYSRDLPKLDSLRDYNPPVVSEIFADDGTKIGEFWKEKRYLLSPKEIPKVMVQAVVASEDDRFFEHEGIDYKGIVRAFFENLRAGEIVQGGSTITQQVTKALLLTREKTIARKVKEAILATRIEKNFTKEEILYLYLNQIFFGNRSYGVEAAARNYFNKSAKELIIAEAAMIAGLAKAPSTYSPITNPQMAKLRQEYVLDRMFSVGSITKDQAEKAKKTALTIHVAATDKEFNYHYAPWFTEHVRRTIQKTYGEQVPYTHGLKIHTTLNLAYQKAADAAVLKGLRELDFRQGYSGPVQKLGGAEFQEFAVMNHLKIMREEAQDRGTLPHPTDQELDRLETSLKPGKKYQALITKVDSANQNLEVLVGKTEGAIRVHDYTWARPRNLNSSGYNGVYYVRDPRGTFHVGDVVWVSLKLPTADEAKTKGYAAGKSYFALEQEIEVEGALFAYELENGFVRAMVGGKDFRKSEFNRTMQALRQTGSVFKPFLYAAALDKGYTPNTVIEDSPVYYEYAPGRFWNPQNYGGGYKGPTSFRSALVNSRNVVSVRILMDVGTDFVTAFIRKLGATTPIQKYYSMALGSNDMKLFEVTRAFGTFATGGILPELVYIKRMTDRYGRVLEEHQPRPIVPFTEQLKKNLADGAEAPASGGFREDLLMMGEKWIEEDGLKITDIEKQILYGGYIPEGYVLSPRTAYTMVQLMSDIVNYGTGYKVKELKKPAAGKTGTTNDETDVWFVGYSPKQAAGVWVGFDEVHKIGGRETGGKTAAPIFLYYMEEILKSQEAIAFDIPKEINMAALEAPIDLSAGDPEAGGMSGGGHGADFFIYDF